LSALSACRHLTVVDFDENLGVGLLYGVYRPGVKSIPVIKMETIHPVEGYISYISTLGALRLCAI